jgi:large subunit ribosomal protein L19e
MTMGTIRRLAADIMGVGENRVRIKPDGAKEAEKAMTRADVRDLIKNGTITKAEVKGRRTKERRKRKTIGSRRGSAKARSGGKEAWMAKVRSQRRFLVQLVGEDALEKGRKRIIYMRIKSGLFRSKRALLAYLKEAGMVKQEYEPKKVEWKPKVRAAQSPKPAQAAGKPGPSPSPARKPEQKQAAKPPQANKEANRS